MKKVSIWLFALLLTGVDSMQAQSKLAPMVSAYAQQQATIHRAAPQEVQKPSLFMVRVHPDTNPYEVSDQIANTGAEVKTSIGRMLMVAANKQQLQDIADLEGVQLIEKGTKPLKKLDYTRQATKVNEIQNGTGGQLPQAYNGEGIIIGVIDEGFDQTQPAFKDEEGNLRIKAVYCPGMTNGKGNKAVVDGKELEGTLFDTPELMLDTARLKDKDDFHGTHVAGCAAASPISGIKGMTGGSLAGMAPKAELIFCNYTADNAQKKKYEDSNDDPITLNMMYSLNYIADYAKKAGKPFIVTMSLNTHEGTHDGTSASAQLFKEFCEQGHIMTISTGNEGEDNCHIHKTVDAKHPLKFLFARNKTAKFYNYLFTDQPTKIRFFVYDVDKKEEIATTPVYELKNGMSSSAIIHGNEYEAGKDALSADLLTMLKNQYITDQGGGVIVANGIGDALAPNGTIRKMTQTSISALGNFNFTQRRLGVEITSEEAVEQRAWIDNSVFMKQEGFDQGSNDVSVGEFCTSGVPITVGAWTASNMVINNPGEKPEADEDSVVGEIAGFSSYGEDYAGHQHPFVVAPGVNIYSTANTFYDDGKYTWTEVSNQQAFSNQFTGQTTPQEYCWVKSSGTSMATPVTAGIIALWMQAAKDKGITLTNDKVKEIIKESVDTDANTDKAGIRAGYGKVNAYKGLLKVLGLPTAIKELSQHQPKGMTFSITDGRLYTEGAEDGTPVMLYNLSGVVVRQAQVKGGFVSLVDLQPGVYAVQIGRQGSTLIRLASR